MNRGLALGCLCALAACAPRPDGRGALPFQDPNGHPITDLKLPVHRAVSTMQSATEWLVALGADSVLVARTDFDRQPELQRLPSIGGGLDPSAEVLARLRPDVVIGWRSASSINLQSTLERFGIPVIALGSRDTTELFATLSQLGQLVGAGRRADSLARRLRQELAALHLEACAGGARSPETAMVVIGTDPPQTTGGGTWYDTLLETACLRNVFADLEDPWPTVSMEAITARQPRWIVTSAIASGVAHRPALGSRPGWQDLAAVREGRVLEIPADLLARLGPTLPRAARALISARAAAGR